MRLIYFIGFVLLGFQSFAQNGWELSSLEEFSKAIMTIEQSIPENTNYSYETEYKFYEELEGLTPVLVDKAVLICNNGKEIYMIQFGKMMVQNEQINLVCDTVAKTIVITNSMTDFTKRKSFSDFSALQTSGSVIQKKTIGGKVKYYIEFPNGFQYVGAELTMGGALGVEQYILYSKETTFENMQGNEVTSQPRMEITYKNLSLGKQVNFQKMKKITDFIILEKGEYVTTPEYKNYELIDLR